MPQTTFGDLRSALHAPPSEQAWEQVVACLEQLTTPDQLTAIPYARDHLKRWPASCCVMPWRWLRQLRADNPAGPHHALGRALRWDEQSLRALNPQVEQLEQTGYMLLKHPALAHVEHVELEHAHRWARRDLRDLPLPAQTRSLKTSWHRMTPQRLSRLAQAPWASTLRGLDLSDTTLTHQLVDLERALGLDQLERLILARCALVQEDLLALAKATHLRQLRALDLSFSALGRTALSAMSHAPHLSDLEALSLAFCQIDDEGAHTLALGSPQTKLRHLDCSGNGIGELGWRALMSRWSLGDLRTLSLSSCRHLRHEHLTLMLQSGELSALRQLDISSCALGLEGLRRLGQAHHLSNLTHLTLRDNSISAPQPDEPLSWALHHLESLDLGGLNRLGARGLAPILDQSALRTLILRHNHLGAEGAQALATHEGLRRLRQLNLSGNALTDEGIAALAASPHLSQLEELNLSWEHTRNDIGDRGARAMAGSTMTRALRRLNLSGNLISHQGIEALLKAPGLEQLDALDLSYNPLGDEGLRALAQSPKMAQVRHLFLDSCGLSARGVAALLESAHLGQLRTLSLGENRLPVQAVRLISERHAALPKLEALDVREQGPSYAFHSQELRHLLPILSLAPLRQRLWAGAPSATHPTLAL